MKTRISQDFSAKKSRMPFSIRDFYNQFKLTVPSEHWTVFVSTIVSQPELFLMAFHCATVPSNRISFRLVQP